MLSRALIKIINKNDIDFQYNELPKSALGYSYTTIDYSCIIIDPDVIDNDCLHNVIVAEEIGHFFTTIGEHSPRADNSYSDKLKVDKTENKAIKWASDFMVSHEILFQFIIDNYPTTIEEIADYFQVTDNFIAKTFELIALKNPYPKINVNMTLCLESLPSIYILELL